MERRTIDKVEEVQVYEVNILPPEDFSDRQSTKQDLGVL
jgi:hypothetical protein